MKKFVYFLILFVAIYPLNAQWEILNGPGVIEDINELEINGNDIYVRLSNNIYKSSDSGKTWIHLNKDCDFIFSSIKSICATQNSLFVINGYLRDDINNTIYKSNSDGANWGKADIGLLLHNDYNNKFYKYQNDIYLLGAYIFKYNFIDNKWYIPFDTSQVRFSPNALYISSNKVYVGTPVLKELIQEGLKPTNIFIYNIDNKKWQSVRDTLSGIYKYTITSFVEKDSIIFAGTTGGVFISTNQGINWIKKSKGLSYGDSLQSYNYEVHKLFVKGKYIYAIITNPTSDGKFPGSGFIAFSTDNGENWNYPDPNNVIPGNYYGIVDASDIDEFNGRLLIATGDGLYFSSDSISHFEKFTNKLHNGDLVTSITSANNRLFATVAHWNEPSNNGLWFSDDFGNTWNRFDTLQRMYLSVVAAKDSFIIVGNNYYTKQNPWFSTDGGKSFQKITEEQGLDYFGINTINIFNDTVFIGTHKGIYFSSNWGKSWTILSIELKSKIVLSMEKYKNFFFVVISKNTLYTSTDYGQTWSSQKLSYDLHKIKIVKGDIYLGVTDNFYNSYVLVSKDFGMTWKTFGYGMPSKISSISAIESYDNNLFIAPNSISSGGGVLYYDPPYWKLFARGLTETNILSLYIYNKYLFAGSASGIYRVLLSDFGITDVEDSEIEVEPDYLWATLGYPNPAKDYVQAKVWWDTHNDIEKAEIVVYDVYGNRVSGREKVTIIPENEYSGILRWDCSSVPSGVYILTIQHGTRKQAVRMIKE